jgi:hypothetical protein
MKAFWDWVLETFTVDYQKEIEEYLADSVNHADLENRMRTLMRRGLI